MRRMIIDIHVHQSLGRADSLDIGMFEKLLCSAQRVGIDRICLLGDVLRFGVRMTGPQVRAVNDDTMTLTGRFPRDVSGFCFLNPTLGQRFIGDELKRCVRDGPLIGIKLEIDLNARDRRLNTIMQKAAELGVPVLHHAWYLTVGKQRYASDPSDIADLAGRFPETRIIMAHLGGAGMRGVLDIQPYKNVLIDTSGAQPFSGLVEYAVAKLGAERVVFGSDVCCRDFPSQLGRIMDARIASRERRLLLGQNAVRLLKLEGQV